MYKVTVTKETPNPNYEEDVKRSAYSYQGSPSKVITVDVLVVDLTEKEFSAMKRAIIEVKE